QFYRRDSLFLRRWRRPRLRISQFYRRDSLFLRRGGGLASGFPSSIGVIHFSFAGEPGSPQVFPILSAWFTFPAPWSRSRLRISHFYRRDSLFLRRGGGLVSGFLSSIGVIRFS